MNRLILEALERAKSITASDFNLALEIRKEAQNFFESLFLDYDAIITPSALSEPPLLKKIAPETDLFALYGHFADCHVLISPF